MRGFSSNRGRSQVARFVSNCLWDSDRFVRASGSSPHLKALANLLRELRWLAFSLFSSKVFSYSLFFCCVSVCMCLVAVLSTRVRRGVYYFAHAASFRRQWGWTSCNHVILNVDRYVYVAPSACLSLDLKKKKILLLFSDWKIRRIEVVVVVGHGRRRLMTSSHPPKRFYCGFVFKSMRLEDEDRYRLCLAFGRKSERMKWPAVHVTHDNDDDNDFSKCRESESIGK